MNQPRTRHPRPRTLVLAMAGVLAAGAVLAESGTVLKATDLYSEPLASSSVVAKLSAKQSVEITQLKGAWAGIKTAAGEEGWARVLNVRTGSGTASTAGAAQIASVFATGTSGTNASAATGVKGLSAAELMSASPNFAQVDQLDGFATTTSDAAQFAKQVPLSSQQVAYLAEDRGGRRRDR